MAVQEVEQAVSPFTNLSTVITLLIALSVATERLTEIVKGGVSWLNERKENTRKEAHRKAALQGIAVLGGVIISALTYSIWKEVLPAAPEISGRGFLTILAMGLLASGGSGFWNSMLSYVTSIKDLKRETLEDVRAATRGERRRIPEPAEGELA